MTLERETKLQVPPGFRLPDLNGDGVVAVEGEAQRFATTHVEPTTCGSRAGGAPCAIDRGRGGRSSFPARVAETS